MPSALARGVMLGVMLCLCGAASAFANDVADLSYEEALEEYDSLVQHARAIDTQLQQTERGTDDWRALTEDALESRQEVLSFLSSWLRSGNIPESDRPGAHATRLSLLQNIIVLNAQLGRCSEARGSLLVIEQLIDFDDPSDAEGYELARARVAECEEEDGTVRTEDLEEPEPMGEGLGDTETTAAERSTLQAEIEDSPASPHTALSWALIGGGAAVASAGLIYDLALLSDRSTFSDIQDLCASPDTRDQCVDRFDEGNDIADRLNRSRPVIITLYTVGLASTAAGAILLITSSGGDDDSTSTERRLHLTGGPGDLGVGLRGSF